MFFERTSEAYRVASRMLLIFPVWLAINTVFSIMIKVLQCEEKSATVHLMTLVENLIIAVFAVSTAGIFGTNAVWAAFPVSDLVYIAVSGGWLKLRADFGVSPEERGLTAKRNVFYQGNSGINTLLMKT